MARTPIITKEQIETFDGADDFVRALHPLDKRWGLGSERWIYRGHWDADWKLRPSIYRAECVNPFLPHSSYDEIRDLGEVHVARMEQEILVRAFDEFDDAGLPIPDPMNVRPLLDAPIFDVSGMLVPFMALAQHYGVPTRLLDWTRRATVAAYFAAAELVKHPNKTAGMMEVIALHTAALEKEDALGNLICRLWKAPRASNANLHAQAGVFTVCVSGAWSPFLKEQSSDAIVAG